MRADLHQHLWPDALLAALARREAPPRLRRRGTGWELELAGEAPAPFDLADHDPVLRALTAERDEIDLIGVAPSLPLGIEALPAEERESLLCAFNTGVLELGAPFALWASTEHPAVLGTLLDRGALGLCLSASALDGRSSALLDVLEVRNAPLFVHPGPAPAAPASHAPAPAWWPALTSYVAEMHAGWHAFAAQGRAAHPRLRVLFAMLAGGAPLHAERLAARGGPASAVHDPLSFFDVSSYGPRTVDAMLRVVGVDRLICGTDRPVIEPVDLSELGDSVGHALAGANVERLLTPVPIEA